MICRQTHLLTDIQTDIQTVRQTKFFRLIDRQIDSGIDISENKWGGPLDLDRSRAIVVGRQRGLL